MLRGRVRRVRRAISQAAAVRRSTRVAVALAVPGGGLERLGGSVAHLHDGIQSRRVRDLALKPGKLRVVRGDCLPQAVLPRRSHRRVALLLRLDHERGIVSWSSSPLRAWSARSTRWRANIAWASV